MSQIEKIQEEELIQFNVYGTPVSMRLEFVQRINLQGKIIPIPRSPMQVVGVTKIENNILPILDLEKFLPSVDQIRTNKDELKVLIVTSVNEATFALQISSIPKVVKGIRKSAVSSQRFNFIPDQWIEGFVAISNDQELPILDPNEFWLGLSQNGLSGSAIKPTETDKEATTKKNGNKEKKGGKLIVASDQIDESILEEKPIEDTAALSSENSEKNKNKTKKKGSKQKIESPDSDEMDKDGVDG